MIIYCPVCKQEFVSEMSMKNHFRNLHDSGHWAETFEKVLQKEKNKNPSKKQTIDQILTSIDRFKRKDQKAKTLIELNKHIQKIKSGLKINT